MAETCPQFRILVVDDNPDICEDFKKILLQQDDNPQQAQMKQVVSNMFGSVEAPKKHISYTIDVANDGKSALQLVHAAKNEGKPYALGFMDVLMPPGWDGIETTAYLWEVDPDMQIVICTAYSNYSWDEMIAKLGINDKLLILKKPFDTIEVRQIACCLTQKWLLEQGEGHKFDRLHKEITQVTQEVKAMLKKHPL